MPDDTLLTHTKGRITTIGLNRPEAANALSLAMMIELTALLIHHRHQIIVLHGIGKHFCAGADLHGMQTSGLAAPEENTSQARVLATMLETVNQHAAPVIAHVHGAAYGGGFGLAAAADMVMVTTAATFRLPEVAIGLVPATISPYLTRSLGRRVALRYALTTEIIDASEAVAMQFALQEVDDLAETQAWAVDNLCHAPAAMARTKALFTPPTPATTKWDNAQLIATVRAGDEAQAGIDAFRHKRPPPWKDT
ncbi:MAG: enoyl-CoA hydratase/isomerase family protein [Alphaproteobacteria bacterium]|nr:enoyl-CoA hydratase/isomerase family protein [Alphaproteobacteria bacterium]